VRANDRGGAALARRIVACRRCPELRAYCAEVARVKRRAFADWTYWGKPVPAFGDPGARLLIVGLAPAAHGANRTGRVFTGDSSGDWLYRALYRAGFANQAQSVDRNDGLTLRDALITATIHCAPPANKPTPAQMAHCSSYLDDDLAALRDLRVVVVLGAIAMRAAVDALRRAGFAFAARPVFGHGAETIAFEEGGARRDVLLLASYHPSRQNTNTRVLTEPMLDAIFTRARAVLDARPLVRGDEGAAASGKDVRGGASA
jgi:uracil-DNA glycosylase